MAQVDFSNAVLDVFEGNESVKSMQPLNYDVYLRLGEWITNTGGGSSITSSHSTSILTNTPSKVSILHTGTFAESGTAFLIGQYWDNSNWRAPWKVSNISFSNGDTYSFVIDIETSGNT